MNEEEYEELARWLPCHPGRWVAWPEPFGTRAEADWLFESLRDGGCEAFICDRLGFGVPWLPLRTGRRVLIGGRQRPGRPVRRLGWSIDEAGQSGQK